MSKLLLMINKQWSIYAVSNSNIEWLIAKKRENIPYNKNIILIIRMINFFIQNVKLSKLTDNVDNIDNGKM